MLVFMPDSIEDLQDLVFFIHNSIEDVDDLAFSIAGMTVMEIFKISWCYTSMADRVISVCLSFCDILNIITSLNAISLESIYVTSIVRTAFLAAFFVADETFLKVYCGSNIVNLKQTNVKALWPSGKKIRLSSHKLWVRFPDM